MTEWILTSSVLILLVIAVRGLFKNKMKAKYVYALWLIVLVRLLCPLNFGELSFNLLSLAEEGKAQIEERMEEQEVDAAREVQKEFYESHGIMYADPDNPTEIVRYPVDSDNLADFYLPVEDAAMVETEENGFISPEINWQKVLPFAWIAGMTVMVAVIFSVNISFSTTLGLFRKELPVLEKKGRGKQELAVYLADGIHSSCLYGVVHPSIYLNKEGMGEQEKNYCVEHEYSHYLQGDMVWSLCRTACLILHWYNPLVWLAVLLSKKDAELACDERTIERLGEEQRYSYGHTLVELAAKQSRAVQVFGMATLMASDKKEVVERVKAITIKKETKIITGLLVALLVVGIGFFVFTGEAKGEQENNKKNAPVATVEAQTTATPAPTKDPALEEFIEKSKEERSRNELLTYILETNKFPVEGSVLATMLNVRSAAGYDADRIDILSEGTTVIINAVEQDADGNYWYAVSYEQKDSNWFAVFYEKKDSKEIKNGYVNSAYLTEAGAVKETIAQIKATTQEMETRIVEMEFPTVGVTTESIYLRPAPGYEYKKSNPVGKETRVTIFAAEQDKNGNLWYYVGYSWGDGYTSRGYADSNYVVVDEAADVSAELFRLYKSKDVNGEYTELINAEHTLSGIVYGGEGWSVDLNGDGIKENLYIDSNGVFINGERAFTTTDSSKEYWILDIDTTDSFYELLNGNGDLYIYDGTNLQVIKGISEIYFAEDNGVEETLERYLGTLGSFVRIDEHTISFEDYHSDWAGFAVASYSLNENHDLCRKEQLSEVWEKKR